MVTPELVTRYVKELILAEASTGFSRLRRVPSSYTRTCLDRLAAIGQPRREILFDGIARRAPVHLGLAPPPAKWEDPELAQFHDEVLQAPGSPMPSRLLRGMAAAMRHDGPEGYFANMPAELVQKADSILPTSASRIRKDVKKQLAERFSATADNIGGGNWLYRGESNGRSFAVLIDYGGRMDQLRYYVQLSDAASGVRTKTLNYETLLGMGFGRWDLVTADSQAENVELLAELLAELVGIPDRLAAFGSA